MRIAAGGQAAVVTLRVLLRGRYHYGISYFRFLFASTVNFVLSD